MSDLGPLLLVAGVAALVVLGVVLWRLESDPEPRERE